jgi:hypothetical protein
MVSSTNEVPYRRPQMPQITVWKYRLGPEAQIHSMPKGAYVIHVGLDPNEDPCLWALVDPNAAKEPRHFQLFLTGQPVSITREISVLGSIKRGSTMYHVFEIDESK